MIDKTEFISKLQNCVISFSSNRGPGTLVEDIINKSFEILNNHLFDHETIIVGISAKGLFFDDYIFTREESEKTFVKAFINYLNEAKISKIIFYRDISLREYILFISLMSKPPDFYKDHKQVYDRLKTKAIRNIQFEFVTGKQIEVAVKPKKAVIVSSDLSEKQGDEDMISHEEFEAYDKTVIRSMSPVSPASKTQAIPSFIENFDSIIRHGTDDPETMAKKRTIIKNMISSLSPEAIIELIDEYHEKSPQKNSEFIYPYIDYDKFTVLSSHIIMLITDELKKENTTQINFQFCMKMGSIMKQIAEQPHLSHDRNAQAKSRVIDIMISYKQDPEINILTQSGILKGRINVTEIIELCLNIILELNLLGHKDISKIILKELMHNLDNSRDEQVSEGFRRILKGLLEMTFEGDFNLFRQIIDVMFNTIRSKKVLSPLYNFACETASYYATMLIKSGNIHLLRDILQVLNLHKSTKSQRSAEQWYKARLTINAIGQNQALKDSIASFFWMDEKKRSELILVLLMIKESSVKYLLNLLSEAREIKSRKSLISALVSLGKDVTPDIISELGKKQPWYYTRNLILILGKTKGPETANYIKEYLKHEDKRVRKEAVNALINLKDTVSVNYLLPYLSSETEEDPYMVKKIISSLEILSEDQVSYLIIRILNDELYSHIETEEEDIKQAACYIAGRLRMESTIPLLKKLISKKSIFGINKGHSDSLRTAAIYALFKIGGQENEIRKYIRDESPAVRSLVNDLIKS